MKRLWVTVTASAVAALIAASLSGCGGGADSPRDPASHGALAVAVRFPAPAEAVTTQGLPQATNSVRFHVRDAASGQAVVAPVLVTRPAGEETVRAEIHDIPPGQVVLRAEAFATADGTGAVIAEAETVVTVQAGETAKVGMVADRLPVAFAIIGPALLERGAEHMYVATARDADGDAVLGVVFSGWTSDAPGALQVGDAGRATAVAAGTALLSVGAAFGEATWTVSREVEVFERAPATVEMTPASLLLTVGEKAPVQARALDGAGLPIPYAQITWHSTAQAVATVELPVPPPIPPPLDNGVHSVDAGVSGAIVTAVGPGAADVIATAQTAGGEAEGACHVQVVAGE